MPKFPILLRRSRARQARVAGNASRPRLFGPGGDDIGPSWGAAMRPYEARVSRKHGDQLGLRLRTFAANSWAVEGRGSLPGPTELAATGSAADSSACLASGSSSESAEMSTDSSSTSYSPFDLQRSRS